MKAGFYASYATRSLVRGGQRTLLAIFCIAVGVMAMVTLQLVGNMVNGGLTGDIRAQNGGDLAVFSYNAPLPAANLSVFDQLTSQGVLTDYTAAARVNGETADPQGASHSTEVWAVDPATFPLAGAPQFVTPANGSFSSLLNGTDAVVTQNVLTDLGVQAGDTVAVHTSGRSFTITIKGVIKNNALFTGDTIVMAFQGFAALPSTDPTPLGYRVVYADVPGHTDANAATAKHRLQQDLPLTTITTTKDALQTNAASVQQIRYFLQVVGLLALLIGGIGIINTMQVLLRRRQAEIAVLKTAGYHRRDLYLLFGIEAGLLGLIGGIIGAVAGIGVSFLVKGLVENALMMTLPSAVDPVTVLSGVAVGFFTALIFGLLPIVQASQIRPVAVLKTAGYHRRDLYLLFGIEAGLLGLLGGIIGAVAGIGVSFLVKGLVENALMMTLPSAVDPVTVLSGVAVGFFTALIFGLLPIVQASQIRPVAVLRGFAEHTRGSLGLSALLGLLLVALFFALALSVLQNLLVSLGAVVGGGLFLLLLSLAFMLAALLIGKLPVPERFSWKYGLLFGVELVLSIALTSLIPAFGLLCLALTLMGVVVVLAPRTWKSSVKMALRNIGRKKARTSTTLVALFVGVFTIGLILTLSQSIHTAINGFVSSATSYNAFIQASSTDKAAVDQALAKVSGIKQQTVYATATGIPLAINGVPLEQVLNGQALAQQTAADLSGITGYDLASGQLPTQALVKGAHDSQTGSQLTQTDAGSANVVVPQALSQAPLNLKLGDQVTLAGADGKTTTVVTIVGFYTPSDLAVTPPVLGDISLADMLTGGHPSYTYSLIIDPDRVDQVLRQVQQAVPSAGVINLAEQITFFLNLLNNLIILLTAVASLAMLAGLLIIANAVALAMLERRRELGILKAVGYTSRSVLGEVLFENGMIGFAGSVFAMLLATLMALALAKVAFNVTVQANPAVVLGVVAATSAVCIGIAALVAWGATRVRPLEVLRYE